MILKEWSGSGLVRERKGEMIGDLRLGIIPTVAPYLLPLFLNSFLQKYPGIRLRVTELNTEAMVDRLKKHLVDAGILVTPLDDPGIFEQPLFYEEFVVYVSPAEGCTGSARTDGRYRRHLGSWRGTACAPKLCICVH